MSDTLFFKVYRNQYLWGLIKHHVTEIHKIIKREPYSKTYNYYTAPLHILFQNGNKELIIELLNLNGYPEVKRKYHRRLSHEEISLFVSRDGLYVLWYTKFMDLKFYQILIGRIPEFDSISMFLLDENNNIPVKDVIDIIKYKRGKLEHRLKTDPLLKDHRYREELKEVALYQFGRILRACPQVIEYELKELGWSKKRHQKIQTIVQQVTDSGSIEALKLLFKIIINKEIKILDDEMETEEGENEMELIQRMYSSYGFNYNLMHARVHVIPVYKYLLQLYDGKLIPLIDHSHSFVYYSMCFNTNGSFNQCTLHFLAYNTIFNIEDYEFFLDQFLSNEEVANNLNKEVLMVFAGKCWDLDRIKLTIQKLFVYCNKTNPIGGYFSTYIKQLLRKRVDESTKPTTIEKIDTVLKYFYKLSVSNPSLYFNPSIARKLEKFNLEFGSGDVTSTTIESPIVLDFNNYNNSINNIHEVLYRQEVE